MEIAEKVDFLIEAAASMERTINRMHGSMYALQIVLAELYASAPEGARSSAQLKLIAINLTQKETNPDFREGVLRQTRMFEKDML